MTAVSRPDKCAVRGALARGSRRRGRPSPRPEPPGNREHHGKHARKHSPGALVAARLRRHPRSARRAMDMLAASDQENFAHGLRAAAASKPLNAGLHGLAARTPAARAPKTPFQRPLNDENAVARGGKSALHTRPARSEKPAVLGSNAFVTPAGTPQAPRLSAVAS